MAAYRNVSSLYQGAPESLGYGLASGSYYNPRPTESWGSDKYAQKNRSWLAREQWSDYQTRFQPYEDQLIDAVTGSEMLDERLGKITINNRNAFDASALNADQYRARYGIQQSEAQKSQDQNNQQLAIAKANANAMNQTRTHVYDRNMAVIGGGEARQMATAV